MAAEQLQLFNPDNPPHGWSKDEANAKLEQVKARMRQVQIDRIKAHNVGKHSNG